MKKKFNLRCRDEHDGDIFIHPTPYFEHSSRVSNSLFSTNSIMIQILNIPVSTTAILNRWDISVLKLRRESTKKMIL
jgi:hypothetical protein